MIEKQHRKDKKGEQTGGEKPKPELSINEEFLSKIEKIKETPKLPINNLFIAVQFIGDRNIVRFGRNKNKFYISFGGYKPKTAREKALFLSVYYAFIYYAVKDKEGIYLTDLMDNIGCNRRPGHGYLQAQKEEVLEMIWNVAKTEIGVAGDSVPKKIKELFPEIEDRDSFRINIFSINIIKQFSEDMRLKDVVILFRPNFDKDLINFDRDNEVLKLGLHEPELKNLAIFFSYGKNLKNAKKIVRTVKELLEIAKLEIDRIHPERTYYRLVNILETLKHHGYIENYEWEKFPPKRTRDEVKRGKTTRSNNNWFENWLDTNTIITFKRDKK
ncbi:MAG: hypothetical protein N2380_06630 [bacterium]|nr:hypothetical protein [bacterium]